MKRLYKEPEDISEALSAYVDDELDPAERREVEELLANNASYAQEVEELRLLKSWLRELPAPQPRRSFTLDPASAPRRRLIFPMLRWATAVAALLLMLTVGVDVLGGTGDSAQTSAPEAAMTLRSMPQEDTAGGAQEGAGAAAASPAAGAVAESASEGDTAQEGEGAAAEPAPDMGALTGPEASPETEEQGVAATMADEAAPATGDDVAGADTTEVDPSQTVAASPTTTLRIIQWVLLATTLALGVGSWLAWRRNL